MSLMKSILAKHDKQIIGAGGLHRYSGLNGGVVAQR